MTPPLPILHRDDDLLVLDKPSGVPLLADRAGQPSLWDTLRIELASPLPVHRLDKGTSGVLIVALSRRAQSSITRQLAHRTPSKFYAAVVIGHPEPSRALIDLPLKPGRKSRYRVAGPRESITLQRLAAGPRFVLDAPHDPEGHASQTRYRVLRSAADRSLVLLRPLTGRTHQLRVHLAWCGWPIAGDALYGRPADSAQTAPRLMLHCASMSLRRDWIPGAPPHPITFHAPIPAAFLL